VWLLGRRTAPPRLPEIAQLTFRVGAVENARFGPGGRAVVYTALFDGRPSEVYEVRLGDPETRPLALAPARVLAVSSRDELAVLTGRPEDASPVRWGTLVRVPLSGGAPRPVREGVIAADWSPNARELAILMWSDTGLRLEYPVGTVLAGSLGDAGELRLDPSGERAAVLTSDAVLIVDRSGSSRRFDTPHWAEGLAWDKDGRHVWVSAAAWGGEGGRTGRPSNMRFDAVEVVEARGLWRLSVESGRWTEVYRAAGGLVLDDVTPDGRILAHHGLRRGGIRVKAPGEARAHGLGDPPQQRGEHRRHAGGRRGALDPVAAERGRRGQGVQWDLRPLPAGRGRVPAIPRRYPEGARPVRPHVAGRPVRLRLSHIPIEFERIDLETGVRTPGGRSPTEDRIGLVGMPRTATSTPGPTATRAAWKTSTFSRAAVASRPSRPRTHLQLDVRVHVTGCEWLRELHSVDC
jgi:hypothetical protein